MHRLSLVLIAAAALAIGGAAFAAAQPANEKPSTPTARGVQLRHAGLLRAAATYVGLTRAQLAAELRSGRSLAQVAAERGKSVEGLKAALLAAVTTRVNAAVANGRIDAARAQQLLQRAPRLIQRLVERTSVRALGRARRAAKGPLLGAAASYVGLTRAQLVAELRQGKSLAQVATAQGKSVDGLAAALLAAVKTKVDAAVAAGRLDAARAQRILERARARIDRLVRRIHRFRR